VEKSEVVDNAPVHDDDLPRRQPLQQGGEGKDGIGPGAGRAVPDELGAVLIRHEQAREASGEKRGSGKGGRPASGAPRGLDKRHANEQVRPGPGEHGVMHAAACSPCHEHLDPHQEEDDGGEQDGVARWA